MELILKEPIKNLLPSKIEFNYLEIISQLKPQLEVYKNTIYTEEQLPVAKADRAKLNNFKKNVEDWRKDIKREYLKPYEEFEQEVKQIVAIIDETNAKIDEQVKLFEDNKKSEKMAKITEFYNTSVGDLNSVITFEKIFKDEWLNVTFSMKKVQEEMMQKFEQIKNDLVVITSLKSEYEIALKDYYLKCFDITQTMLEKTRLEDNAKRLKEYDKTLKELEDEEPLYTLDFRITATKTQIQKLKEFLTQNNIKYGKCQ